MPLTDVERSIQQFLERQGSVGYWRQQYDQARRSNQNLMQQNARLRLERDALQAQLEVLRSGIAGRMQTDVDWDHMTRSIS